MLRATPFPFITILIIALSLPSTRIGKDILNLPSKWATAPVSRNYPAGASLGEVNVSIGGGGYVTGVYPHPKQQNLIYIKTDIGGFYRWNSINKSWIPLTDRFPLAQSNYYGGEALAVDPNNPNVVYIAAGKYAASWSPHRGTIFKSTDQGTSWTKLNLDLRMGGNENKRWVGERLAVNPLNSDIIFFGSRQDGLWKSSNAGKTWAKVTTFSGKLTQDVGITAIAFDKKIPGLAYAVAYGDGIYKSNDTGTTWHKIPASPPQTMQIAVANNNVLYVTYASGVSKYVNGVWTNITPDNSPAVFNALSVSQADPNDLLVCIGEATYAQVFRSRNGGATWAQKRRFLNSTTPWWSSFMLGNPWIASIKFDPKVAGRVWFTDWFGVWKTDNINAEPDVWTNYTKGHEELVVFALVSPPSGPLLLSGVADVDGFYHNNGLNAYPSKTLGPGGPGIPFQDTYSIAYSKNASSRVVRVGGARQHGRYTGATSTDGGLTWNTFKSWQQNRMPLRVAVSPSKPDLFVVIVSDGQPIRTTNSGASWSPVLGLPNGPKGPWYFGQPLAADQVSDNIFYYYDGGKVYRSSDSGQNFTVVNSFLPTESWSMLKTVEVVDSSAPGNEVWVSLDWNGLYRSTNSGVTFAKLAGVERSHLFAFGKPQPGSITPTLYVYGKITGMGEGIFRSLDKGKTWTSIGNSQKPIGNEPSVMEASKQRFGLVFIGTNGRGIYYGTP